MFSGGENAILVSLYYQSLIALKETGFTPSVPICEVPAFMVGRCDNKTKE
jgi:hypothetical protein